VNSPLPWIDSPLNLSGSDCRRGFCLFFLTDPQGEILLIVMDFEGQLLYEDNLSLPLEFQEITNFYLHPDGNVYAMASNGYEMKWFTWDLASRIGAFDGKTR
jgi:hypothetical protein